jgi:hypothetical protein
MLVRDLIWDKSGRRENREEQWSQPLLHQAHGLHPMIALRTRDGELRIALASYSNGYWWVHGMHVGTENRSYRFADVVELQCHLLHHNVQPYPEDKLCELVRDCEQRERLLRRRGDY